MKTRCRCGHDASWHQQSGGRCLVCTCPAFTLDAEPVGADDPELRAFVAAVLSRGRQDEVAS